MIAVNIAHMKCDGCGAKNPSWYRGMRRQYFCDRCKQIEEDELEEPDAGRQVEGRVLYAQGQRHYPPEHYHHTGRRTDLNDV